MGQTQDTNLKLALPYIYIYIRRNCGTINNCVKIPYALTIGQNSFISSENLIAITERLYNNPITHVGPSFDDVVFPRVIRMQKM